MGIAPNVKDARSLKQLAQRGKFALAIAFMKPMKSFIDVGFKLYAVQQTAMNAALSYTLKNVITGVSPDFGVDYSKVMVSKGSLELPLNIQMLNNEGEVALSWGDNSGVGNASDTDFAMPLVYNANKRVAIYDMVSSCRGDEA